MITHVTMEDAGEYSCRVDFRDSPTVVTRMRLTIVEEPRKPVILVSQRVGWDLFFGRASPSRYTNRVVKKENSIGSFAIKTFLSELIKSCFRPRGNHVIRSYLMTFFDEDIRNPFKQTSLSFSLFPGRGGQLRDGRHRSLPPGEAFNPRVHSGGRGPDAPSLLVSK